MKTFLFLIAAFISMRAFAQAYPQRTYPAFCDGNDMISNQGTLLYQFTFSSDCKESLAESKVNQGRFCDDEKLVRENGIVIRNFTFSSNCKEALSDLRQSNYGLFCHDGDLLQIRFGLVADLTFTN